jgi:hypothetical protein
MSARELLSVPNGRCPDVVVSSDTLLTTPDELGLTERAPSPLRRNLRQTTDTLANIPAFRLFESTGSAVRQLPHGSSPSRLATVPRREQSTCSQCAGIALDIRCSPLVKVRANRLRRRIFHSHAGSDASAWLRNFGNRDARVGRAANELHAPIRPTPTPRHSAIRKPPHCRRSANSVRHVTPDWIGPRSIRGRSGSARPVHRDVEAPPQGLLRTGDEVAPMPIAVGLPVQDGRGSNPRSGLW